LSLPGVALFAAKPYFVKELLLFLAALAILFAVGTAICLLIIVHEGRRWSVRKFNEAKQASVLLGGLIVGWRRLELGARNASRKFSAQD
jgi:hypothetical protein